MFGTDIFATQELQDVLKEFGIAFCVDLELNFVFKTYADKEKALQILEKACLL